MQPGWWRSAAAEFIGTLALVLVGAGSIVADAASAGKVGVVGIALAHGLIIAAMVSALGHISGGYFNPAITAGLLATRRMDILTGVVYIAAQLLGAIVAASILRLALFPTPWLVEVGRGVTTLGAGVTVWSGVVIEMVLTFFLVIAVFGTVVDERGPRAIGGLAIGLTLAAAILFSGPFTGGSLNPARSFGPALVVGVWSNQWVYWLGPLLGGVLGGLVYKIITEREEAS